MKLNKIIAAMLTLMLVGSTASVAVSAVDTTNPYEAQAAEYDKEAYSGSDLGAVYSPASTTFKVWSPSASAVKLNLYTTGSDSENGAGKLGTYDMTKGDKAVWSVTLEGDYKNIYYTYSVTNKGTTKETCDPYAKAVGVNGDRAMVVDLDETDPSGWNSDNKFTRVQNQTDASVWEVHVKDFSVDPSSGVSEANRGKYLAFTETGTTLNGEGKLPTGVDYLKKLGINYVQINPFYDYASVDETGPDTQFNWGYDPKNYNVPEGSYSSNPYDGNVRINEAKQMIKGLHDNGVGVIMDVVYNHTYNTDSPFQHTVPDYYYRMNADGSMSNGSGCGDDTASEREMYRKYMVDSVLYWAREYHIDGFRFDLMGLHDVETMNLIREELDKIDPNIIMYGEGWTLTTTFDSDATPATQTNASQMNSRVGFFNDQIRDGLKGSVFDSKGKGYIQGANGAVTKSVFLGLTANTTDGNWVASQPEQTVTYASCHDNATVYDRLVYSMGGEFDKRYDDYVKRNKLSAAITYGSQGTTFMLAGEEMARTKLGDENSFSSSVDINKLDWNRTVEYGDLLSYYQGMHEFRSYFDPVRTPTKLDNVTGSYDRNTGLIQMVYANQDFAWKNVVMLFNNSAEAQTATLDSSLPGNWIVVVNGQRAGTAKLAEISSNKVEVPAGEALFLVDKTSYEASGVVSNKGEVEVRYIDDTTNTTLSTVTLSGDIGDYYSTTPASAYDLDYKLVSVSNNNEGKYTKDKIVVEYHYVQNNVSIKDISGDNEINLVDAVMMNRHILGLTALTDEQQKTADINMNGSVDLSDVVLVLRNILGYAPPKAVGTVTVSYVDADGNQLMPNKVTKMKAGEKYTTVPADIEFYNLDEENLPDNATGTVSVGDTSVVYKYILGAISTTVHVKMPEGFTGTPNIHVWEDNGAANTGTWPGLALTDTDGDGWYEGTFATSGTYNWIVNDGTNQTTDQKGFNGDQWIVINDDWTPTVATTVVSVKIPDGADWTPNLYTWQTAAQTGGGDNNPTGGWPGKVMTDFDKDGWYTINFYCQGEGSYNWIVNDGKGNQTADNENANGSIWVVMSDAATVESVSTEAPAA